MSSKETGLRSQEERELEEGAAGWHVTCCQGFKLDEAKKRSWH